jgi:hypothetical protein
MGNLVLTGAVCFIVGLIIGYIMDEKPIIIRKFTSEGYGTSSRAVPINTELSVNDDLG